MNRPASSPDLPEWQPYQASHLEFLLEKLPPAEVPSAAALVQRDAVPPLVALPILENLVRLTASDRKMVYRASSSEDPNERGKARALALAIPRPIDPGILAFRKAVAHARKAARVCHAAEFKARISAWADEAAALLAEMEKARREHP